MSTEQLIDSLKRVLKSRHMTYAELARRIRMSEASVKRLFSQQTFTLNRLEQVLTALDLDFFDLAKLARGAGDAPEEMTETQEHALAGEPRLMGVFYLLFNDWQPAQILARYELTEPELTKLLLKLDRLQLIELLPSNKVKIRVGRHLRLRPSGAIRAKHGQRTMAEFLAVEFDRHGGNFRFEFRDVSPASFAVVHRKLDRLAAEFNELAELDSTLPPDQRQSIGIVLGMRPWKIGQITNLKERPRRH
jgi:transcriptional regulator with XRE-family HTH domain